MPIENVAKQSGDHHQITLLLEHAIGAKNSSAFNW